MEISWNEIENIKRILQTNPECQRLIGKLREAAIKKALEQEDKMFNYLFVGGFFDDEKGRSSGYISKLFNSLLAVNPYGQLVNGGKFEDLQKLFQSFNSYNAIFWMPDVPNDKEKLVPKIKSLCPYCMLITSKNNIEGKYTFHDLIQRALISKSNLFLEFTKEDNMVVAGVYDPLGNCFGKSKDVEEVAISIMNRLDEISAYSRIGSICVDQNFERPVVNERFLELMHKYADVFHECIHAANPSRFLGNASFRCERGFPAFKDSLDQVYVSKRNIDKREIGADGFVPVNFKTEKWTVEYKGLCKPSVDAPIQCMLFSYYPMVKYVIHSHTYITSAPMTKRVIPCGSIEEFFEIVRMFPKRISEKIFLNLKGHGSLVLASDVEMLENIPYISRPLKENQYEDKEELYRKCLQDILDPLSRMRKQCEDEGAQLNGQMAVHLMNDVNYLRDIAREAFKE